MKMYLNIFKYSEYIPQQNKPKKHYKKSLQKRNVSIQRNMYYHKPNRINFLVHKCIRNCYPFQYRAIINWCIYLTRIPSLSENLKPLDPGVVRYRTDHFRCWTDHFRSDPWLNDSRNKLKVKSGQNWDYRDNSWEQDVWKDFEQKWFDTYFWNLTKIWDLEKAWVQKNTWI